MHQTFTIGGLTVSKDTYFCFYSDTSGSMNSTIKDSKMSSVPEVVCKLHLLAGPATTMVLARGTQAGRVNDAIGLTDQLIYVLYHGMEVSGPGVPAGTSSSLTWPFWRDEDN